MRMNTLPRPSRRITITIAGILGLLLICGFGIHQANGTHDAAVTPQHPSIKHTSKTAASTAPVSTPSAATETVPGNTAATVNVPNTESPAPSTVAAAKPKPSGSNYTPAPLPWMFNVSINDIAAYNSGDGTTMSVPFTIYKASGHTFVFTTSAAIIGQPSSDSGATCNATGVDNDSGYIYLTVPDAAPAGQYTCRLTVTDGVTTKTDEYTAIATDADTLY
jgi:hypothetical protein